MVDSVANANHSDLDRRTIQRAIWGERSAFEALVRRYDQELRRIAFRIVGQNVDDALQDAYVKVYRALPTYDADAGSLRVWLHRIVYRSSIDLLRQESRQPSPRTTVEDDHSPSPQSIAVNRASLGELLDRLDPELRAVAFLVDGYGFSYADAGNVIGVPEGTIASRVHRARALLRQSVEYTATQGTRE